MTEKHQAEQANGHRETFPDAESIVETVREPLVVLDGSLRVLRANRSFYRAFGVKAEETEGRLFCDLGNRQWDIRRLRTLLEEILPQSTTVEDFEVEHTFESIGHRVMLLNARRIYGENNQTELILLAIEDITERRRAEDERRELETRFTSLVKNIKDHSIFTMDLNGRITSWNVEAERVLGYTEAEALGQHFSIIFSPDDVRQGQPDQELRTAGEVGRAEDERWHVRKGGEPFWALGILTPTHDARGRHTGYSKILRDMTDRKRAEEEVRFQAQLLDTVGQAVIATDPDGQIIYLNGIAETLYGWPKDEAIGRNISETIVPPSAAEQAAEIMARLRAGESWSGEFMARRKGGMTFAAFVNDTPVFDSQGRLKAIIGVSTDLTDRKRLEEELRQRVVQLGEADRLKDEFLAVLAHELRNPLAPIRNALNIVQVRGRERRQAVRQAWEIIKRQVEQVVRLVDDLLDVSRISLGKIKLQKGPTDVAIFVARAVESSRPIIEARRHKLEVTLPDEPMLVEADPTRMAQVLMNLLNNAVKYSPEGGRIWLTAMKEGGECVIRVRDTGMGIPAEILPKLFDLFTQAERTLDRAEGGLGIGLTLVRRLTEMHNGRVEAFSDGPGEGSEFVVRLPILSQMPPAVPAHEPDSGRRAKASVMHRILVVDDNRDSADSLAMLLRLVGHDVRTVHDGRQALVVAATYQPDLVLLDIGLPGMDGFTVARHMRSQPELAGVVLVALTGYGSEEDRHQAQEAGFNHHMVKPVHFDALIELLAALEPQKR
jgi:PAS domain S-box-containing protein